jgi:hypothetical protein
LSILYGILIEGFPPAGESFPTITVDQARKFGAAPLLLHFGTNPPVAVLEYDGKTYYHHTEEPGLAGSRKTEAAKARDQRITEARDLLKNHVKLHAKQESETKALDSLNNAAYKLSLSVCKARSVGNTHAMRNYRRKKAKSGNCILH